MSKKFKIPKAISRDRVEDQAFTDCWKAARKHGKHADKAHSELMVAWDTALVLKGFLNETHIAECMQAATLVEQIEQRVSKAYEWVDKQSTQHSNLFIAYFDLKGGAINANEPQRCGNTPEALNISSNKGAENV